MNFDLHSLDGISGQLVKQSMGVGEIDSLEKFPIRLYTSDGARDIYLLSMHAATRAKQLLERFVKFLLGLSSFLTRKLEPCLLCFHTNFNPLLLYECFI